MTTRWTRRGARARSRCGIPWHDCLPASTIDGLTWWVVATDLPEGMTVAEARARGLAWTGFNPDNVGPRHRNKFSWLDRLRIYRLCDGDYRAWGYPRPRTWPEVAEIYRFLRAEIAERIAEAKAGKVAPLPPLKV